jgi:hypothetical protein
MGEGGALVRQATDADDDAPAFKIRQRLPQPQRRIGAVEMVSAFG